MSTLITRDSSQTRHREWHRLGQYRTHHNETLCVPSRASALPALINRGVLPVGCGRASGRGPSSVVRHARAVYCITAKDVPQQPPALANASWAALGTSLHDDTDIAHFARRAYTTGSADLRCVEGTLREICQRLTLMWLEFFDIEEKSEAEAVKAIEVGHRHVDELMSWLDWSVWVRCEPAYSLGVRD